AMGEDIDGEDDDDRHVKLEFTADANVQAGTVMVSVGLETHATGCPGKTNYLPRNGQTVAYEVTLSDRDQWDLSPTLDRLTQTAEFSPVIHHRQERAVATGYQFHRNSVDCESTDVAIKAGADYFKLGLYNAAGARQGSLARSFSAVAMKRGANDAADRHVRLLIDATMMTIQSATVAVEIKPNSSCTASSLPLEQTVSVAVNVAVPVTKWNTYNLHVTTAASIFSERDLHNNRNVQAYLPPQTGMGFRAAPDLNPPGECGSIEVSMVNPPPFLRLLRRLDNGQPTPGGNQYWNWPATSYGDEAMRNGIQRGGGTRGVRAILLVFPRDSGVVGGVHAATVVAKPAHADCQNHLRTPWPLTVAYTVTIRSFWRTFGGENLSSKMLRGVLATASAATDTGVRLHRGVSACQKIDVRLVGSTPNHIKLRPYDNNGMAHGGANTSFSNLHSEDGALASRHLRVFIDPRTNIPGSTVPVEVEYRPNASCNSNTVPTAALTVSFNLTVTGSDSWRALPLEDSRANIIAPAAISVATTPTDAGIRIHQATEHCGSIDAALATDAPAYVQLAVYRNDGTADSSVSPARSLAKITMNSPETPEANRHLRLLIQAGATVPEGRHRVNVTLSPNGTDCNFAGVAGSRSFGYDLTFQTPWVDLPGNTMRSYTEAEIGSSVRFRDRGGSVRILTQSNQVFRKAPSASCQVANLQLLSSGTDGWPLGLKTVAISEQGNVIWALEPWNTNAPGRVTIINNVPLASVRVGIYNVYTLRNSYWGGRDYRYTLRAVSGSGGDCPSPPVTLDSVLDLKEAATGGGRVGSFTYGGGKNENNGRGDLSVEAIKSATVAVESGIVFHPVERCHVSSRLAYGAPSWLQLRKYRLDDTPDGGAGVRFDRYHERAVRVQIKPGATVEPGTITFTLIARLERSGCPSNLTFVHVEGDQFLLRRLTIRSQTEWLSLDEDEPSARQFARVEFRKPGSEVDTEMRFHRSAAACRIIDVGLKSGAPSEAKLRLHQADGTPDGNFATSFSKVRMEAGHADDRHVRLYFERFDDVPTSLAVVTVTAAAATG
ncbi:MAG: hypothetical protein ISN26_08095, partial [Betaproteobacteria bacterium AqS2]|nr:hypothetical protein [Betaproteobacteria bacterium AqS2]